MGKQKKQTIGYSFLFGIHMGVCRAADQLMHIKVGDRDAWRYDPDAPPLPSPEAFAALETWKAQAGTDGWTSYPPEPGFQAWLWEKNDYIGWNTQVTSNQTIRIKAAKIFGGDESEGGIDGTCDVMFGAPDQPLNIRLAAMLGGIVPAFRGSFMLFFDGMVSAMSKYPKPWSFRIRRALNGWDGAVWNPSKAIISLDGDKIKAMNPAHIIYECLTNRDWGRGIERARLDDASFTAAANALYTEGFGLCLKWSRQEKIGAFIQIVQDHIGANLFLHRVTGLWTLRLVRDDYVVNDLPLFTPDSGLLGVDDDDNAAGVIGANEIIVTYFKTVEKVEGQERVQNAAAIRAAGGIISETVSYLGIPTPELAARVAQRDLRAKFGIKRFKVRLDRRGYKIEPGGAFRITDPARGISNLVVRAGRIEDGTLAAGTITITAVMDVFGLPANTFIGIQPSTYTPPTITPQPITHRKIMEVPYRDLAATLTQTELSEITPGTGFVSAIAAAPNGFSQRYFLDTRVGSASWLSVTGDFAPTATLQNALPNGGVQVWVSLTSASELSDIELGSAAVINNEICRVDNIDTTTSSVLLARGCSDSVPASHAALSRIFFYQDYTAVDQTEYASGISLSARLRTQTGAGVLPESLATVDTFVMANRSERPYPPGNVLINTTAYPEKINGALSLEWSHRDRLLQADQLIDQTATSIGPEVGTTYSVKVLGETTTLVNETLTATTKIISLELEKALSGAVDYGTDRDLRTFGLSTVSNSLSTALKTNAPNSERVVGGWMTESPAVFVSDASVVTSGVAAPTPAISNDNPFSFKTGIYYSDYDLGDTDPYIGWAVSPAYNNEAGQSVSWPPYVFHWTFISSPAVSVKYSNLTNALMIGGKGRSARLVYWVTQFGAKRSIYRHQPALFVTTKAMILAHSAPVWVALDDYYEMRESTLNSTGTVGVADMAKQGSADVLNIDVHENIVYATYIGAGSTFSTASRSVDITNILTAHISACEAGVLKTKVFTINSSGVLTLLRTNTGKFRSTPVNSTQLIEIDYTTRTVKLLNSTTGTLGAAIVTLPAAIDALCGDPANNCFYVLMGNDLRQYDAAGTMLAQLIIGFTGFNDIQISQSKLYLSGGYILLEANKALTYSKQIKVNAVFTDRNATPANDYKRMQWLRMYADSNIGLMSVVTEVSTSLPFFQNTSLVDDAGLSTQNLAVATPRLNGELTVELNSNRDGLTSHSKHIITTTRTGYGLRYGESYGG